MKKDAGYSKKKKKEKKSLGLISSIPFLYPLIKIFFCHFLHYWQDMVKSSSGS